MLLNVHDYKAEATKRVLERSGSLSAMSLAYYESGANDEVTLHDNVEAFKYWRLRPSFLSADVSHLSTQVTLSKALGAHTLAHPIALAPTAFHRLADPEHGELATVRAASATSTLMALSTLSTTTLEEVAVAGNGTLLWFQLYVFKDRSVTEALVRRAEKAGYSALVVTVDTPMLGRREVDIRNGFHLPDGLKPMNFVGMDGAGAIGEASNTSGLTQYVAKQFDPSLSWSDIVWLKSITAMPILVKGILTGEDAKAALAAGVDGIIVSNHGGRQLDTVSATIDCLPEVVAAVSGRVDVFLDGGIRRGTDVLKALALGARAVFIGRPLLWGLAVAGESGVQAIVELLRTELELAMGLAGVVSCQAVSPTLVERRVTPLPSKL